MTFPELIKEIESWPGIESGPHRFGGLEFRHKGSEIGHIHGERQADIKFSVAIRKELVASGQAELHHLLPETGWISFYFRSQEDIPKAADLFRRTYEFYKKRK